MPSDPTEWQIEVDDEGWMTIVPVFATGGIVTAGKSYAASLSILDALCPRHVGTRCGSPAQEPHPCPYLREIEDDATTLCRCCDDCSAECSDDV